MKKAFKTNAHVHFFQIRKHRNMLTDTDRIRVCLTDPHFLYRGDGLPTSIHTG